MRTVRHVSLVVASCLIAAIAAAQSTGVEPDRMFRISGHVVPDGGASSGAVQSVQLEVYDAESGGTRLWSELQAVSVDAEGRFSALLGSATPGGVPVEVFAGGQPRWLATRADRPGAPEPPRMLLTSVPYALTAVKARDADTLGGLPAAAFLKADDPAVAAVRNGGATAAFRATSPLTLGTPGRIGKFTTNVDLGDSVMTESSSRIGVGTTTPLDFFHTRFSDTTGAFTGYAVQNMSNGASSYSGMLFYDHAGALRQFQGYNNSTGEYRINNISPAASINFMTGSTSRFKVNTNGFIGIGNNAPDAAVHIGDGLGSPTLKLDGLRDGVGAGLRWTEEFSTDFGIEARFDGRTNGQGALVFRGIENGTVIVDNLLVIHPYSTGSNGVGIGVADPLDRLHVGGDIRVGTGTTGCVKDADGTAIGGVCSSDLRFKKDVAAFEPLLERFSKLTPVHYQWRASEFPAKGFGTKTSWGFVAQDVQREFPDLVTTDDQGYLAVNYSKVPLLTVQAVRELKSENDALKARLAALEAAVSALQRRD